MRFKGFEPVYNKDSRILILGSFPSVKSRKIDFYYGNPQNRFWKTVCGIFHEPVPESTEGKKEFLLRNGIALWDVVTECEIDGSKDDSIRNFEVADIKGLVEKTCVRLIILNGGKAHEIFVKNFGNIGVPYKKLPSTSPANTRFSLKEWEDAFQSVDGRTE
ncbi:MAG: DNA-deoxyinosine glycosylase [Clostridia bacterium]|nr:DNA-deoxyinosine glycosylase [Clostridia bacterium]